MTTAPPADSRPPTRFAGSAGQPPRSPSARTLNSGAPTPDSPTPDSPAPDPPAPDSPTPYPQAPGPPAPDQGPPLAAFAVLTALLPVTVVHLCHALASSAGLVPGCFPYLDGCTSISATGRYGVSYFIFKGGMIPAAVITAGYWILQRRWLLAVGDRDGAGVRAIVITGVTAAVFLTLYSVFLGSKGDFYNLMRRFGVTVYFGGSYLAHLLLLRRILLLRATQRLTVLPALVPRAMIALAVLLLGIGLGSIPVSNFVADKDQIENAIEWNFCLLLVGWQLLSAAAWQSTGFRAHFSVRAA